MFSKTIFLPFRKAFTVSSFLLTSTTLCYSSVALAQQITGKVVDHQGKPVAQASVKVNGGDQAVITDQQGVFTLSKLSAGNIELHVSAKNYAHNNQYIQLMQNDVSDLTINLSPSVMEVVDVYATPLHSSNIESALPVNVISGDDLKLKQASTLGETLKNEVGVHSSFYGSVASSPIIRGLDGPRVLITQNGLDAGDASRVGADHAVSTETSTATQIEVLRGPATLFYGSGAIGGVVNVVDNRVPTSSDTLADWLLQYNDVSDESQGSLFVQTGNDDFAVHFDGYWRDADDYKLPSGFDAHAHEEEHEENHDEDEEHEEEQSSHLANTFSKSNGFTLGTSYLFDQGFIGLSYGMMNRDYGIPGHVHHEEEHEEEHEGELHEEHEEHEEGTQAKMKQNRFQLLSEVNFEQSFIKQIASKFAYTDYQHQEIEDGEVGTTFTNKSVELKADFYHQDYMNWQGAWTLHYKNSDFKALGDEAFTPPTKTESFAVAWLEEKHFGDVLLQLGARLEQVTLDAESTDIGFPHEESHQELNEHISFKQQKFTPLSASAGLVWDYQSGYNLGLSVALSQRAPSAAELFSFGPHIGTNTFEVGAIFDIDIDEDGNEVILSPAQVNPETSYSVDLTWRKFEGDFGFVVSAFYNQVQDYYYQENTGLVFGEHHEEHEEHEENEEHEEHEEHEEGLPILIYQQGDVDMYGIEAEFVYQINSALKTTLFGDYIHAQLTDGTALPRIPPMRVGAVVNYQGNNFDSEISVNHYFEQDDIALLETTTSAYSLLDFNVNYYLNNLGIGSDMVLYVKGQNLTDEVAKVHSSFLKDIAPLPGRNFSIGIRGSF